MTSKLTSEQAEMRDRLRAMLRPGTKIYTKVNHVSSSGMARWISAYVVDGDEISDITAMVARAGIAKRSGKTHDGVKLDGCGMDMGVALVYAIGRALYADGAPCTGHPHTERRANGRTVLGCASNDHVNGEREYRRGRKHSDGGYAFRQRWI